MSTAAADPEVERRDNHECHTLKLLELCLLPTRGFDLVPIEPLNTAQRTELDDFRRRDAGHAPEQETGPGVVRREEAVAAPGKRVSKKTGRNRTVSLSEEVNFN